MSNENIDTREEGIDTNTESIDTDTSAGCTDTSAGYPNSDVYNDVVRMLNDVQHPKTEEVAALLNKSTRAYYLGRDRDNNADIKNVEDYFIDKYPLLYINFPIIFRDFILVRRHIELDLLANIFSLQNAVEKGIISEEKAGITFGLQNARKFFPESLYKEAENNMKDPHKLSKYIHQSKLAQKQSNEEKKNN